MRTKEEIECDKGCKVFFAVVLLVIIVASYMALNTDINQYRSSSYMDDSTMRYECVDCAKIVTLQNVYIDEHGVVRHLY